MNVTINASEYLYSPAGAELPQISATVRDLGTVEVLYFAFLVWVAAVVCHELGHWIYLLRHNPRAKVTILRVGLGIQLQTGEEADYTPLSADQQIMLYVSGIAAGLIPIVLAGIIHPIYWLVLPAYVVGHYQDMVLIVRHSKV